MPEYNITNEQKRIAHKLGVMIYPADAASKYKIEIYDSQGIFMFRVGDKSYDDYFKYKQGEKEKALPKGYAKWRRSLYLDRHSKEVEKQGSRGWFAAVLLWQLKW